MAQLVKNPPAMRETWVWSLRWEDPLVEGMATHSSILPWRIPWMEEPGGLQSMGSPRVRHATEHLSTNEPQIQRTLEVHSSILQGRIYYRHEKLSSYLNDSKCWKIFNDISAIKLEIYNRIMQNHQASKIYTTYF